MFSKFSEWAPITNVDLSYGKDVYFYTHYHFMGKPVTAYWKPKNWTPPVLTISRLSPIQTRALCTSDVHDIPRLIPEIEERLVFFKSQRPVKISLLIEEHVNLLQAINVWETRLEYMTEKYDTAMKFLWPLMKLRRAMLAKALHPRVVASTACGLSRLNSALLERIIVLSET